MWRCLGYLGKILQNINELDDASDVPAAIADDQSVRYWKCGQVSGLWNQWTQYGNQLCGAHILHEHDTRYPLAIEGFDVVWRDYGRRCLASVGDGYHLNDAVISHDDHAIDLEDREQFGIGDISMIQSAQIYSLWKTWVHHEMLM